MYKSSNSRPVFPKRYLSNGINCSVTHWVNIKILTHIPMSKIIEYTRLKANLIFSRLSSIKTIPLSRIGHEYISSLQTLSIYKFWPKVQNAKTWGNTA